MDEYGNSYEKEIVLKDLFFRILCCWRTVITVSIIFALLISGYKYYSDMRSADEKSVIENQQEDYQLALKVYNTNKTTLMSDIENLTNSIDRQVEYDNNSILMQINPFDQKTASKTYYVSTDYKIMPDKFYQNADITKSIIQSYISAALHGDMYNYIKDNLSYNIEIRYLKELINIDADFDTNMINIKVVNFDTDKCQEIFNLVLDYFNKIKPTITEAVGEHKLTSIDQSSIQSVVDLDLDTLQKENQQLITTYESNLNDKQNALKTLVKPVETITSRTLIMKNVIKYSIAGFIIGAILASGILLYYYLTTDKLINFKDLRPRYNIKVLGVLETKKRKRLFGFIDRFINKLQGFSNHEISEIESAKRISTNLKAISELNNINHSDIIFTGTIHPDLISKTCNIVQKELNDTSYHLSSGANISYTASTIEQIKDCTGVIIIEKIGTSSFAEITKQLENISDLGKNIIGFILV